MAGCDSTIELGFSKAVNFVGEAKDIIKPAN
jgi:hypothetical protein